MARRKYKPEVKAAVMAALLEGQKIGDIAREYDVKEGTIKSWNKRHGLQRVATVATFDAEKKETVGELLIKYLEQNLKTLKVQAQVFSDPDWIKKQDAADMAVLHGVMTDKAVRLVEALERANAATD